MRNVAALPALALMVGAAAGVYAPVPLAAFIVCAVAGWLVLTVALMVPVATRATGALAVTARGGAGDSSCDGVGGRAWIAYLASMASLAGFFGSGAALAADATRQALTPPILADSHAMRVDVAGASGAVPVVLSGLIRRDASATEFGAMFTLAADEIRVDGVERKTAGTVRVAVGGTFASRHIGEWRAGRRVRVTATLAAPLPYLNIGTSNQETRLALAGIRLFGSVKSASQVEVLARGRRWDEAAASARAFVRRAVARHVAERVAPSDESRPPPPTYHANTAAAATTATFAANSAIAAATAAAADTGAATGAGPATGAGAAIGTRAATGAGADVGAGAAIATAILIGDRAGLDQDVEERLQRAGTFHVIAISGGNIAILTALILGLLRLVGLPPRTCAWLTILAIGIYAFIVGSGASVARAALAAIVYLFARAIDHRTPPVNVLAVVVTVMLVCAPLEIVDAGFWLTCLATLAIMLLAQRLADRAASTFRRITSDPLEEASTSQSTPDASRVESFISAALASTRARVVSMCANASVGAETRHVSSGSVAPRYDSRLTGRARVNLRHWLASRLVEPAIGLLAATIAAEAVLLPVSAYAFSQVSIAGLVLNFLAIPLMTIVQVAGITTVLCASVLALAPIADLTGLIVNLAARGIVSSSLLVDAAPWSAPRVAPPPLWLLLACQSCLCLAFFGRPPPWRRRVAAGAWVACLGLVVWALPLPSFTLHATGSEECQMGDSDAASDSDWESDTETDTGSGSGSIFVSDGDSDPDRNTKRDPPRRLRVTFLDVAQGDATLIRFPDGRAWLVDTGGALGRFDIGTRIVSPALWALGLRRLSTLVLTHGDRDHIGGAHAMLRDFRPAEVWEGVPVDGHVETTRLRGEAARRRIRWRMVQTDERLVDEADEGDEGGADPVDGVDIRVWHPSAPQWMRTRVRNDDSIVLELALGGVSLVLPGDIGPAVERMLAAEHATRASAPVTTVKAAMYRPSHERLPGLASPPLRVLKVPHHGSKASSTAAFLDALEPRLAIVSAGRGNRHGHPAPAALARYAARGTEVFRTDRDGAIQLDTDGHTVTVRTCSGRRLTFRGDGHD